MFLSTSFWHKLFCYISNFYYLCTQNSKLKLSIVMKRAFVTACLALTFLAATAQENSYIVKTKNVKKSALNPMTGVDEYNEEEETALDFVSQNFKFYSLCDWKKGMRFMVVPDKYDLVVKTFTDAGTGKEVSTVPLKYKIMVYEGHTEGADGRSHVNFFCPDNNKNYYYEIPSGTFDDYCYSKLGVPTLAYLGDVDMAKEKLVGKTVYTKARWYRIDTEYDGDGYREIEKEKIEEVKVVAVGVGTRNYPVKIIVEDKNGNEFYQNVAISKTNCGMRDDEFIMDNAKFLFNNSFEMVDDIMAVNSRNYRNYIGKTIHTKNITRMLNESTQKQQAIPRMTEYIIESITPHKNDDMFTLKLKNTIIGIYFYRDVYLDDKANNNQADYFGFIFAPGYGKQVETSEGSRAMIRQGHVGVGFSEDEVMLAAGEPDQVFYGESGKYVWVFNRSNNKLLLVHFDGSGTVIDTTTEDGPKSSGAVETRSAQRRASGTKQSTARKSMQRGY